MFKFFIKQVAKSPLIAMTLVFVAGCGGDGDGLGTSEAVFAGLITGVEAMTLLDIESIEVTDDMGRTLEFHAGGRRFAEFTPSHAREHMIQGLGVMVTYRESGDGVLYMIDIKDLPP